MDPQQVRFHVDSTACRFPGTKASYHALLDVVDNELTAEAQARQAAMRFCLDSCSLGAHVCSVYIHASTPLVGMAVCVCVTDLDVHKPGGPQPGVRPNSCAVTLCS